MGSYLATNLSIEPLVWDNVDSSPGLVCSHTSQDVFPFGVTNVTCNATDASGNDATCYFSVTIVGKQQNKYLFLNVNYSIAIKKSTQ